MALNQSSGGRCERLDSKAETAPSSGLLDRMKHRKSFRSLVQPPINLLISIWGGLKIGDTAKRMVSLLFPFRTTEKQVPSKNTHTHLARLLCEPDQTNRGGVGKQSVPKPPVVGFQTFWRKYARVLIGFLQCTWTYLKMGSILGINSFPILFGCHRFSPERQWTPRSAPVP